MDVLDQLMQEDDNPRGRASKFVSGNSLEEAAAAEQRRLEIKAQKWPIGRQEAGILHLIQSKTLFQRLKLPDPRWVDGAPRWDVAESRVKAAYEEMKKCCHPEWAFHPKRDRGYVLLREAFDTLSDANGKLDEYVRTVAEQIREREAIINSARASGPEGGASGSSAAPALLSGGGRAAVASAAAADAAELEEQLANKRKRLVEERMRRSQQSKLGEAAGPQRPGIVGTAGGGAYGGSRAAALTAADDDDDDDDDSGYVARKAKAALAKPKKRRVGML